MTAMPQGKLNRFIVHSDIRDAITSERFKAFISENRITSQTKGETKAERISLIEDSINQGTTQLNDFKDFISVELMRNRNKSIFFSKIDDESCNKLTSLKFVESCLQFAGLNHVNFNGIIDNLRPNDRTLSFLKIEQFNRKVTKITLGYQETVTIGRISSTSLPKQETDFVWIEVDLKSKLVLIRIYDRSSNFGGTSDKAKYLYYIQHLKHIFNIGTLDMRYNRKTLYNIFNELTSKAEEPFEKRLSFLKEETDKYIALCVEKLQLKNPLVIDDFNDRLFNLQARALIQENFNEYTAYSAGKKGIIDRYYYTDKTGASVNAKTNDEERSISLYDIYLDTKHSIDKLELIDKLWVTWYRKINNRLGEKITRIKTKLEVYKECYVIHFLWENLTEEVEEHVLSEFDTFEGI